MLNDEIVLNVVSVLTENLYSDLVSKPAKELGNATANIFKIIFAPVEIAALGVSNFINKVKIKLSKIPEEKLTIPDLQLRGSVFEGLKYTHDKDYLVEMFATLLSNASNVDNQNIVHPAFSGIISKLSHNDALVLSYIHSNYDSGNIPILEELYHLSNSESLFPDFDFYNFIEIKDLNGEDISFSLTTLCSLGILQKNYDKSLLPSKYLNIKKSKFYINTKQEIKDKYTVRKTFERKGILELTHFGKKFIELCLDSTDLTQEDEI